MGTSQGFWTNQSPRLFQLPHLVEPVRESLTSACSSESSSTGRHLGLSAHCPTSPLRVWGCPPATPTLRLRWGFSLRLRCGGLSQNLQFRGQCSFMEGIPAAKNADPDASAEGMAAGWARQLNKPTLSPCFTLGAESGRKQVPRRPLRGKAPADRVVTSSVEPLIRSGETGSDTTSDMRISVTAR